jgi:hypothetical protein
MRFEVYIAAKVQAGLRHLIVVQAGLGHLIVVLMAKLEEKLSFLTTNQSQ